MKLTQHSITVNGRDIAYYTNGHPGPQTVLIVHGFRGNHYALIDFAEQLPQNQRIILIDLPGYGHSQTLLTKHTFLTLADSLNAFYDAINLKSCIVIGHSFGASLGIVFAALYPNRIQKLILLAPVTSGDTFTAWLGRAYNNIALWLPAPLKESWIKNTIVDYLTNAILLKSTSKIRRDKARHYHSELPHLKTNVVIENFLSFYSTNLYSLAKAIAAPTVIIIGSADTISPLNSMRRLQSLIPGSELVIIPQAGHIVPVEEPTQVAPAVNPFLIA